MNLNSNT